MRKSLALFMVFCVMLSNFGVHASTHYCMDRLTHIDFLSDGEQEEDLCACEEVYEDSGCCKDIEVHASKKELGLSAHSLYLKHQDFPLFTFSLVGTSHITGSITSSEECRPCFTFLLNCQWLRCWESVLLRI